MTESVLKINNLDVYYGAAHVLQGIELDISHGVYAILGRNGMGKTTLCNAIMGLVPTKNGTVSFNNKNITNQSPYKIAKSGISYTPQGRRLWNSLSVDEHLRMIAKKKTLWSIERIYKTFPRLAERKNNGGNELSGGEQQMLSISRALLQNPDLLILDEPTEGLAPVIVDHVQDVLMEIVKDGEVAILLVEQNISVATTIASNIAIMVNGQITTNLPSVDFKNNRQLQQQLMGVGRLDSEKTNKAKG
jgi:ABC-type branched-subunit amino acid transport system ATPase component|tara:strand:- start:2904 stop:3644 length:741 start_codon:yes stop_codon:yes gene_type:complete